MPRESLTSDLADRLRQIRTDLYGTNGAPLLARRLGVSTREWLGFEGGATLPAALLERLVEATRVDPIWLLNGVGPRYRRQLPAPPPPAAAPAAPSPLLGRRVRVFTWDELHEVQDAPPVGIVCHVYDLGHGPLLRVRGDGFQLLGVFTLDEVELLD